MIYLNMTVSTITLEMLTDQLILKVPIDKLPLILETSKSFFFSRIHHKYINNPELII